MDAYTWYIIPDTILCHRYRGPWPWPPRALVIHAVSTTIRSSQNMLVALGFASQITSRQTSSSWCAASRCPCLRHKGYPADTYCHDAHFVLRFCLCTQVQHSLLTQGLKARQCFDINEHSSGLANGCFRVRMTWECCKHAKFHGFL